MVFLSSEQVNLIGSGSLFSCIPDSNLQQDSGFLVLYSGFQSPGFRNPDSLTQGYSLFVERVKKSRSPGRSPLEESQKRPGLGERDSSKSSAHHEKIPHTGNAQLHCFQQLRCPRDSITDVSPPLYLIPLQRHQCQSVNIRCHNRPLRGYTGIQYTGTTLC